MPNNLLCAILLFLFFTAPSRNPSPRMPALRTLSVAIACLFAGTFAACDYFKPPPPAEGELKQQFAVDLPAYWRASRFTLEPAQTGDARSIRGRFRAEIQLAVPTYVKDQELGGVLILRQTGVPGQRKVVFGRLESNRQRGSWITQFQRENDPTRSLGEPKDYFQAQRVIVSGSAEEREYWEGQERLRQEAERSAELARIEEQNRVEENLLGEWHGSMFDQTDSRLVIHREVTGLGAMLYHEGYLEILRVELLAGNRILLTGTSVSKLDGGKVRYNLDTFELQVTPAGDLLYGAARDQGGANGQVRLRKVTT